MKDMYKSNSDKTEPLFYYRPHYSRDDFKRAQTIWGGEEDGLTYEYSDRLSGWDLDADRRARKVANEKAENRSPYWAECYLSEYYQKPIELVHLLSGHNLSSGYPYQVFGFRYK